MEDNKLSFCSRSHVREGPTHLTVSIFILTLLDPFSLTPPSGHVPGTRVCILQVYTFLAVPPPQPPPPPPGPAPSKSCETKLPISFEIPAVELFSLRDPTRPHP